MKGIVKSAHYFNNGGIAWVFIAGDDGQEYFGHGNEFVSKNKHYKPGVGVTFDAEDRGHAHQDAVNIALETPPKPGPTDELLKLVTLPDGAWLKRVREPSGKEYSLIIKEGHLVMKGQPVFEKDMVWVYQRGPSGDYK